MKEIDITSRKKLINLAMTKSSPLNFDNFSGNWLFDGIAEHCSHRGKSKFSYFQKKLNHSEILKCAKIGPTFGLGFSRF